MQKKGKGFFNLETTLEYAANQFKNCDPEETASRAAVEFNNEKQSLTVFFLQEPYTVMYPSGEIYAAGGDKASVYVSIILLHYLNTSDGTPLSGRWISFKELPGGQIYIEPFRKRALVPFLKVFGDSPSQFMEAASKTGGFHNKATGEYSMVIPVLPRVPVNFILHPGDEEFSAAGNILFDSNASCYLPTEDYAHLPGMIIRQMQMAVK